MESEDRVTDPRLLNAMESYGRDALNDRAWHRQIDLLLWEESKKKRNYAVYSVSLLFGLVPFSSWWGSLCLLTNPLSLSLCFAHAHTHRSGT